MQVGEKNSNYRHGGTFRHQREYNSWRAMKERCDNPNYRYYHRYGGRGITYCKRWENFANFFTDMGERPLGYSLDRINNDGNYCPQNCRWTSQSNQTKNSNKCLQAKLTKEQLSQAKCSVSLVYKRIRNGWDAQRALSTPPSDQYNIMRQKALARHRICPVCGVHCKRARDRYCCREHFQMSRDELGRFSKEVKNNVETEKKEAE